MNQKVDFEKISSFNTANSSPGFLLWQVSTKWRASIKKVLQPVGLTHPQFVVLACIAWLTSKNHRVMQNEVGKMACLDPNTLSQVIRGLEQKELVRREALEDKRAKKTILTSKGASLVKKALPKVELEDQDFFKKLTKAELKLLVKLCQKLNF